MFKFELRQLIFYLRDNKVCSASIMARFYVDTVSPTGSMDLYKRFGEPNTKYSTCHGIVYEQEAFASKQELLESL
jgi:hypothetical protein